MDFSKQWYINIGSSTAVNVPTNVYLQQCCKMLVTRENGKVESIMRGYKGTLGLPTQFFCKSKTVLKKSF